MKRERRKKHEEGHSRLLEAGWEARLRGGLIVWRRPNGRGSWYTQGVAMEVLEAMGKKGRGMTESPHNASRRNPDPMGVALVRTGAEPEKFLTPSPPRAASP